MEYQESEINFYNEDVNLPSLDFNKVYNWIKNIIQSKNFELIELNYIFCSDEYLLDINKEYLDHDYYTDIITFDNSEEPNSIEGDIFISLDRVKENAEQLNQTFDIELIRVLSHGVLHLLGLKDKTEEEEKEMRIQEEECIQKWINNI